ALEPVRGVSGTLQPAAGPDLRRLVKQPGLTEGERAMTPFRGAVGACALWLLTAGVSPTQAAWNNVFQVCCDSCGGQQAVSAYAPDPCCNPCPQPVCTTRYVARCYYQPVTCYQTKTYYEPVTTYRTSYYYEPVTSYRYSCYYDPCSCSYQNVACPSTCYRLRSQCCPVPRWT